MLLTRIAAGSTGDGAGLKQGDILVSIDGVAWTSEQIRLSRSFGKAGDKATPGEKVILSVLKAETDDGVTPPLEAIEVELLPYPRTKAEEGGAPTNDTLRPDLEGRHPMYRDLCWKLIRMCGFEAGCLDLLDRIDRSQQIPDPDRLPIVRYVSRDPFKMEAISREIVDGLEPDRALGVGDCAVLLDQARHVLIAFETPGSDAQPVSEAPAETYVGKDLEGHLDYVESVLWAAAKAHKKAFAALVAPRFTASLKKATQAPGIDPDAAVVLERDTPHGPILVAGHGRQRYEGKAYGDEAAPISKGGFSQGCGDLGVGILVDLAGNDNNVGLSFTQGAGFMGVGMLFDEAGDDVYRGVQLHQGIAQHGAGFLVDRRGRDRYEALMVAQGVGLAAGYGMLYDGGDEGDSYYCKGKQPTGYGTAGVYEGWGQGVGIGYRPYASGGRRARVRPFRRGSHGGRQLLAGRGILLRIRNPLRPRRRRRSLHRLPLRAGLHRPSGRRCDDRNRRKRPVLHPQCRGPGPRLGRVRDALH